GITLFFCFAWPRPFVIGGVVMAVAASLEALQALTPDRTANLEAALCGAGGALAAALVAELFIQMHLVPALTAVAAALASPSYVAAAKQVIATKALELGWSPEAKQMIASWTPAPSLDPAQVQQITQSLAAVQETVQELAGSQRSMARDIARLESAVAEILKIKEPLPQPPAAPRAQAPGAAIVVTGAVEDRACITKPAAHLAEVST